MWEAQEHIDQKERSTSKIEKVLFLIKILC